MEERWVGVGEDGKGSYIYGGKVDRATTSFLLTFLGIL